MPQVEPPLQVVQPADLVRRNVGGDRLQAAGRAQQVALGVDDPRQVGAVQHVVVVDGPGDHAGGLLGGQPAQRLHEHLQLALGQLRFDLAGGCAAAPLETSCGRSPSVPLRPASRRRRARSAGGPPAAAPTASTRTSVHSRESGEKYRSRMRPDHLRVLAVRAEVLEQIDRRIGGCPSRTAGPPTTLPGSTSVLRRLRAAWHAAPRSPTIPTAAAPSAWATSRTMRTARGSSGVSIEMMGLPAWISSLRLSDFIADTSVM